MPQAKGGSAYISFCEESQWAVTPSSPAMTMLKAATYGESLAGDIEELKSNAISDSRAVQSVRGGNIAVAGSVPFEMSLIGFSTLLKHALGSAVTTGSGPYTHTIKRDDLPAGLTIEKGFPDINQYFVYTGCKVESIDFNVESSGLVTGTMNILAKDLQRNTSPLGVPTSVPHEPIVHHEASIVREGGVSAEIKGFGMSIKNNIETDNYIVGNRFRSGLNEGEGECDGSITLLFTDGAAWDNWRNEATSSIEIQFTQASNSLNILLPKIRYTGDPGPKIDTAQGIVLPMNYRAIYDAANDSDVVLTINNTEANI